MAKRPNDIQRKQQQKSANKTRKKKQRNCKGDYENAKILLKNTKENTRNK